MQDQEVLSVVNPFAIERLRRLLTGSLRIGIFCHARPDGDAIGSSIALGNLLSELGHEVMCIAPNAAPTHIAWTEGTNELLHIFETQGEKIRRFILQCDLLFCLDFNDLARLDEPLKIFLAPLPIPRVMIDHHPDPTSQFDLYFSMPNASSTCELLTEIILTMWGQESISKRIAIPLYMGLMTDTGSFSYSCARKRTFEIAGILVEQGVDVPYIQDCVYNSRSYNSLRLQSALILQHTAFCCKDTKGLPRVAIISFSLRTQEEYSFQPGDTEGIANLPLTIDSVQIGILLSERGNGTIRVSTRATKRYTINQLMRQYFNGGGHPQASGGTLHMSLKEAFEYTRTCFEKFVKTQPITQNLGQLSL